MRINYLVIVYTMLRLSRTTCNVTEVLRNVLDNHREYIKEALSNTENITCNR